jgi:hypothetical protein
VAHAVQGVPDGVVDMSVPGSLAVKFSRCSTRAGLITEGTTIIVLPAADFGGPNRYPPPAGSVSDRSTRIVPGPASTSQRRSGLSRSRCGGECGCEDCERGQSRRRDRLLRMP